MPGALGLLFRKIFFPMLVGQIGKGAVFGPGVIYGTYRYRVSYAGAARGMIPAATGG